MEQEINKTDKEPGLDAKTRLRLRVTAQAAVEYAATVAFLFVYVYVGSIGIRVAYQILAYSVFVNAIFFVLIYSGISKRFKDPSMTTIQMLASCCGNLLGLYLAPNIWYLFVINMFVELPFGALYFDRRSFFRTWLLLSTGLGITLTLIDIDPGTILVSHTEKFLLWVVLTSALARFLGFNSRISTLRYRLKQKVKELEELSTRFAQLATHDDLTGLINRREFNRRRAIESSRSLRSGIPHSLAVLDIDHFKTINDRYGHATGDLVLKQVAQILHANCRSSDALCRFGGEEFALLLEERRPAQAHEALERLRLVIERHPWEGVVAGLAVTISIGAAVWREDSGDDDLFAQADAALYRAKKTGRNRVVVTEA